MRSLIPSFLAIGALVASSVVGQTVDTSSGPVKGHASPKQPQVSEYLGIPFAQAPVGDLRFAPPVKFTSEEVFDASNYSPDCPQTPSKPVDFPNATEVMPEIVANFAGQKGNPQSEDCLKLNVWSKESSDKKKPVLVWIYGGRFSLGSTNNLYYQGQNIAAEADVIVVSLNYRVNIFGFSGAPDVTQNVGLLDQRLAIEWVRDNIEGFGGDPDRITIFGQSAGGVSVDYYTYAYNDDPIISGVISMSGTALSMKPNTPEQSTKYWNTASEELGCGDSDDVLACVRSKPVEDILAAVGKVPAEPSKALPQPVFHPTVDDEIVFSDYESLSSQGKFMKVPYLVGNTDYEAGYYKIAAYALNIDLTPDEWDLFNLAGFTCSSAREAANRAAHDVPVWRYRYYGQWPNSILFPGSGAYHGSDVPQVFGTAEDVSGGVENTPDEQEVSSAMMHAWATFAADPAAGLSSSLEWPKYASTGNSVVWIAHDNKPAMKFVAPEATDERCADIGTDTSYAQGAF